MTQILACPLCRSRAEVFATGTAECYGWAWQSYGVECLDEHNQHCEMSISVDADFSYLDVHDSTVIELWNELARCRKP